MSLHAVRAWVSSLALIVANAAGLPSVPCIGVDVDGDGVADEIIARPTEPGEEILGEVQVRSGASSGVLYTLHGATPSDLFAFAIHVADLNSDSVSELMISAPRFVGAVGSLGKVRVFNAASGAHLFDAAAPRDASIGLAIASVDDQNGDDVSDILVAGGVSNASGVWTESVFLYSGADGALLVVHEASLDAAVQFAQDGGRLYLSADLNGDGIADGNDILAIVALVGSEAPPGSHGDVNWDGHIDAADVQLVIDAVLRGEKTLAAVGFITNAGGVASVFDFAASWAAVYPDATRVIAEPDATPPPMMLLDTGTPCTCGGGIPPSPASGGPKCGAGLTGCPTAPLRIGDDVCLQGSGSAGSRCFWSVTGDTSSIVVTQSTAAQFCFTAVAPGSVSIRFTCEETDCCACSTCTFDVTNGDAPDPCQIALFLEHCPTTVLPAGANVSLHAVAVPPGNHFEWLVIYDTGPVVSAFGSNEDWANIRTSTTPGYCTIMVRYGNGNCSQSVACTFQTSLDVDGDGLLDAIELAVGTDVNNPDSDGDGFQDGPEHFCQGDPLDADHFPSGILLDTDRDGLSDFEESCLHRTDPLKFDSDDDGLQDLAELALGLNPYYPYSYSNDAADGWSPAALAHDRDRDFLFDEYELSRGLSVGNPDSDGDGILDGIEVAAGTDPLTNHHHESADSDQDGLSDYEELYVYNTYPSWYDTDDDGLPDFMEVQAGLNPSRAHTRGDSGPADGQLDLDFDQLSNNDELIEGTNLLDPDSDDDGVLDGLEVRQGSSPVDASDGGRAPAEGELCSIFIVLGPVDPMPDKLCELYDLHVGPFTVRSTGRPYPFYYERLVRKGQCFPIRMEHQGRRDGCPPHFNYSAYVGARCCSILSDPLELLGSWLVHEEDRTQGLRAELCLPLVDIDVDADNSAGLGAGPDGTEVEERAEERPDGMKLVIVNRSDSDDDGVLDFADGFNSDGIAGNSDDHSLAMFTPITVRVGGIPRDRQDWAALTFTYDAAQLTDVERTVRPMAGPGEPNDTITDFAVGAGRIRVWKKSGTSTRVSADFIRPGAVYPLSWFDREDDVITLYVEAVNGSAHATPISATLRSSSEFPCVNVLPGRVLCVDPNVDIEEEAIAGFNLVRALASEVVGTPGNDLIIGQENEPGVTETIHALDGDDIIILRGGTDAVHCGPGRDLVFSWRGEKDIYLEPSLDIVSRIGGNVLAAAPLTNIQTRPRATTPAPSVTTGDPAVPFTAQEVRDTYVWAFGLNDPLLAAFEDPDHSRGKILVVPSFSSIRPAWLTIGTWDFERIWNEADSLHECIVKIEYTAEEPMSAAIGLREALLTKMPPRVFDEYFHAHVGTWQDPCEFDLEYRTSRDMREQQLQNVEAITLALVNVYMSAWLSAAGPAGEVIDLVMSLPDLAQDVATMAQGAFTFICELPGRIGTGTPETEGYLLEDLRLGLLPEGEGENGGEEEGPLELLPPRLWGSLRFGPNTAFLARSSDIVRIRFANNVLSRVGFIMRKRMNIRPSRENLNILLVGTAQHIQGAGGIPLPRHHTTIERLVTEMCETGRIAAVTDMPTRNYLYIGMNRSVRTMVANAETGQRFATCSSNRPDILGVWRDAQGRIGVDMFEVRSGTQGGETLLTHLRNTITTLPQDIVQGTYRVLESD